MAALRDFVSDVLELEGAAVEAVEPDGLEVLAPGALRQSMGWPELARLGFGPELPPGAVAVGFEGDWLAKFGALLGARGAWAERQATLPGLNLRLGDAERQIAHAIDLPNAIWRLQDIQPVWTRLLLLAFRYSAVSDEKREGMFWLGFNQGTGAGVTSIMARLQALLAETEWQAPEAETREAAGPAWSAAMLEARATPLVNHQLRLEMEPFLRTLRRRLERDRDRIHDYYNDMQLLAQKKLAAATGEKAADQRKREQMRIAAAKHEYAAKLDDLRHNYALSVKVEWAQGLEVFVPVQRLSLLVKRRKGERLIHLDWHPAVRFMEPLPADWGPGLDRTRLACDEHLHLTEPAGQAPCPACAKPWCRACHPKACPRCGA